MPNISNTQPATAVKLTGVDQVISDPIVFLGVAIADGGLGAARVHIYNGTTDNGFLIAGVTCANNDDDFSWYGPNGVLCPNGIYIKVYAGSPEGAVFYR